MDGGSTLVAHAGAMVRAAMAETNQHGTPETETNVDVERVHLVLSPIELDILADALRSVDNVELAERLETLLRQVCRPPEAWRPSTSVDPGA